jgi:alcohol dehydrogenase
MLIDFHPHTRLLSGPGTFQQLGKLAAELGFRRTLLVADHGMRKAGYADRAARLLADEHIESFPFDGFAENPDTAMCEAGRQFAAPLAIDSIIGLGGGSSLDCAKGINFVLTNGGSMKDYWGHGKASKPMQPMIGIPTTAGTGSEAQSYALISDAETHVKMACGDPKAAFRIALLDAELCLTAPAAVRAAAGYDAVSHAVESWVTAKRNPISSAFAREAWRLLDSAFDTAMREPQNVDAMDRLLLGSHLAGMAIENSMLGATHACANPLTARYGTVHGVAIALLLRRVVEWNASAVNGAYDVLHPALPQRLEEMAQLAGLPRRLRDAAGVAYEHLPELAAEAAKQWTGTFNPRPFDEAGAREVYECAW